MHNINRLLRPVAWALALTLLLFRFASTPPLWWDEGWTLSVAKNFIESGHFGLINAGVKVGPGISGHYPVILAAALSFKLFGVGIWQGRLPFVVMTAAATVLVVIITRRLNGPKAATAALFAAVFLVPHPFLHPLINGRQVLGDIPAALFLLAGAWAMDRGLRSNPLYLLLSAAFWALAHASKAQVPIFLAGGVLVTGIILAVRRMYRPALLMALTGAGAIILFRVVTRLFFRSLPPLEGSQGGVEGLFQVVGFVLDPAVRSRALLLTAVFALPFALGLASEGIRIFKLLRSGNSGLLDPAGTLLWSIAAGWFAWYLLFSNSGDRYLATPILLATPFTGNWLDNATRGLDIRKTIRNSAAFLKLHGLTTENGNALFAVVLIAILVPFTIFSFSLTLKGTNQPLLETVTYLNTYLPKDALIETYDSELFLFLERTYHFPPDQVHVDLLRRHVYRSDDPVDYDPLVADPDFLVVGPQSVTWRLYDSAIEAGSFDLIEDFGPYKVYTRTSIP